MSEPWKVKALQKQASVKAKIPEKWILNTIPNASETPNAASYLDQILPKEVVDITNSSIVQLFDQISAGTLTATKVTEAFCHRAAYSHQLLNCCSEIFFDKALDRAKELDEYFSKYHKVIGPLHGIPISLKDQINLEGIETSIGYVGLLGKPATKEEESTVAVLLRNAGAVFYLKTTVPMAMMSSDTHSNAFGQTLNAINRKLSPGGSSGGEGALIASKGSLLGLGTDIGGSVRIPANANGIYSLRPSTGRFPYQKLTNSMTGQMIMPSVLGPLARDLDDIEYFSKVLLSLEPWLYDSRVIPLPYREIHIEDKLSFGVMKWDGLIHPHPPVNRAIEEAIKALQNAGHEVISWEPQNHQQILDVAFDLYDADGGKEIQDICDISGEPCLVNPADRPQTINEFWANADKKYQIQERYFKYWMDTANRTFNGKPVSAWISPVWESASFEPHFRGMKSSYTATLNVLDCSVVIVPITTVDKNIDKPELDYKPISNNDKLVYDTYDPELFHGTPVCVQVITRILEEEKAIAIGKLLRDAL